MRNQTPSHMYTYISKYQKAPGALKTREPGFHATHAFLNDAMDGSSDES